MDASVLQNLSIEQIIDVLKEKVGKEETVRFLLREKMGISTVRLGTGPRNARAFCEALSSDGFSIDKEIRDIPDSPALIALDRGINVDVVDVSVKDLGCPAGARYKEVCMRGLDLGYRLCPPELAYQLRRQYVNQPVAERLYLAMKSVVDSYGNQRIFAVGCDENGPYFGLDRGGLDEFWFASRRFVFIRPRRMN